MPAKPIIIIYWVHVYVLYYLINKKKMLKNSSENFTGIDLRGCKKEHLDPFFSPSLVDCTGLAWPDSLIGGKP